MTTETIKLIRQHRSIRKFTDEPIAEGHIEQIMLAAQAAATSSHMQCVSVVQVNDKDKREQLAHLTGEQKYVAEAANFFVFCADFYRHAAVSPKAKFGFVEQLLTASIDAGIAAQNALLAAQSLGLGGVYIGGIRNHPIEVVELLDLPEHVFPLFGLCLGHPAQQPGLKPRLPLSMFLHQDSYQPFSNETLLSYDQQMRSYYQSRSSNAKEASWTQAVQEKYSKESRPFMMDCLHQQGFAKR